MAKKAEGEGLEKKSGLELALDAIRKAYGEGSYVFGNADSLPSVKFVHTGCYSLDKALGGGWPVGRIIEVYGPESSGKTTLTIHALVEFQRKFPEKKVAFIDVEHAFDGLYAMNLGLDHEKLIFCQPSGGEEALNICEILAKSKEISAIVIDSVAALMPQVEGEKKIGESSVGRQAMLMSQAMRKIPTVAQESETTIFFINQIRMKIGIMYGSPETTSGGEALKFATSQRVEIRRTTKVEDAGEAIANLTRAKVVKNKVAPPFKVAEFEIVYGKGINKYKDLVNLAVDNDILERSGSWIKYNGESIGQGDAGASKYIIENPEFEQELREKLGL